MATINSVLALPWREYSESDAGLDSLRGFLDSASESEHAIGRSWYPREREYICSLSPALPARCLLGAFSALSPRVRIENNRRDMIRLLSESGYLPRTASPAGGFSAYGRNIEKASRILESDAESDADIYPLLAPRGESKAPKICSFYRNLAGESEPVTVDVWITRAWIGALDVPGLNIREPEYRAIEKDIRRLAVESDAEPRTIQAIVWLAVRRIAQNELPLVFEETQL